MKVTIYHYHGKNEGWEELTGYQHLQEWTGLNLNMISLIIEQIWEQGLNVMLIHSGENSATIYIDDKTFKQR